jgi:hypothetical protein
MRVPEMAGKSYMYLSAKMGTRAMGLYGIFTGIPMWTYVLTEIVA